MLSGKRGPGEIREWPARRPPLWSLGWFIVFGNPDMTAIDAGFD
ncbi:hypothetical protein CGLO_04506 [Colletotrichum gloeosporioides Cg-14]|uniref:Uncharacterized protein n=1 Tax=Colletotrichum gloeosporioides (strain Cg-14) TaxID=1237896 RepID=T0LUV2_COLGC|nr:hypothetical protein CGLO_04506 [Colletotrichum gloeosporioides Cg-14]